MPGLRAPGDRVDLTLESVTQTTALYSLYTALGDPLSGTIYATDSSNNTVTATIVTDPGTGDITAEFTSLEPGTTYTIPPQAVTGSDSGIQSTYTFTTLNAAKLYGSVNGQAKRIKKLYGSIQVPVYQYRIDGFANNTGFNPTTFMNKWQNTYGPMSKEPDSLLVSTSGGATNVVLVFADNIPRLLFYYPGVYTNQGAAWGFAQAPASGAASYTPIFVGYDYKAKRIAKLYGSVNGSAKLIYEDLNA